MIRKHFLVVLAPLALLGPLVGGCSSSTSRASDDAAAANTAFNLGQYGQARAAIEKAVGERDDITDYWDLYAKIAIAQGDYPTAMRAYRNVLSLDRANVSAMSQLCELAVAIGAVDDQVKGYADQLLLLNAADPIALLAKGSYAMRGMDFSGAIGAADQVLAKDPDNLGATILKAQTLMRKGDNRDAAQLLETSLDKHPETPQPRLRGLTEIYRRLADHAAAAATAKRLAAAAPDDAGAQLGYADMLYQDGDAAGARAIVLAQMRAHGADTTMARRVYDMLAAEGGDAFDLRALAGQANGLSAQMKAVLARYALLQGRADVAAAVLGPDVAGAPFTAPNLDAKVALAQIAAARGAAAPARAILDQVLQVDPAQPTALVARARLELATGAADAAITDARRVLSDDAGNGDASLALSDALNARHEPELALSALRDAVQADPRDVRVADRLARVLLAAGNTVEAGGVLRGLLDASPVDARVRRLRGALCPRVGPACGAAANPVPGVG